MTRLEQNKIEQKKNRTEQNRVGKKIELKERNISY